MLAFGMFAHEGDPEVLRTMLASAPAVPRRLVPRIGRRVYARRARKLHGTDRPVNPAGRTIMTAASGVRLRGSQPADDAALVDLFADSVAAQWNPGPAAADVPRWRAGDSELDDDTVACGSELEAVLPKNHVYGDGELHDEHRHVRVLDAT